MMTKLAKYWPIFLFLAAFLVCGIVFADALPLLKTLNAPDSPPVFSAPSLFERALPWLNGQTTWITHDNLLQLIMPMLAYHEVSYMVATALVALSMGWYLRVLRLPVPACVAGGLAMAFSGYHFTLFSAGHRGYFIMMPYALFMFVLIERILARPRWFHFVLLPICFLSGFSVQPDVMVLLVMLLVAYKLFRFVQITARVGIKTYFAAFWKKFLFGAVIALVVFVAAGWNTLYRFVTETMKQREQQISQTVPKDARVAESPDAATAASATTQASDKTAAWVFATNWSMPPEDAAEFVVPCLRGIDSANQTAPYWGRLGRTLDWETTEQGHKNFRQHTLYLGVIQVVFALFAVLFGLFCARRKTGDTATPDELEIANPHIRGITLFWFAMAVVSIVLAMGRFTPVYKLFYAIPMMDKLRAPVKFVHLTEIAAAVLFAVGVARLLTFDSACRRSRNIAKAVMLVAIAGAACCLIARATFAADAATALWKKMQFDDMTRQHLVTYHTRALMRSTWMFVLAAIAVGAVGFSSAAKTRALAVAFSLMLIPVVVLDMGNTAAKFVSVTDIAPKYEQNPAAEPILNAAHADETMYSYLMLFNQIIEPSWIRFLDSLFAAGIHCMDPTLMTGPDDIRAQTFTRMQRNPAKLWKYWGAAGIFADFNNARHLMSPNPQFPPMTLIGQYSRSADWRLAPAKSGTTPDVFLLAPKNVPPSAAVFYGWRKVPQDRVAALDVIAAPEFDLDRHVAIAHPGIGDQDTETKYTPAVWNITPRASKSRRAVITANADAPGMLYLREHKLRRYPLTATVNGKPAPVYTANAYFTAVPVDAGESVVVLTPRVSSGKTIGLIAMLAFTLGAFVFYIKSENEK